MSPDLYIIKKVKLKVLIDSEFNLTLNDKTEKLFLIKQADNMIFRQIRRLTKTNDKYNKYIVFVDCKGNHNNTIVIKKLLQEGFYINGIKFDFTERSASMSRNGIIGFIDATITSKMNEVIDMGLDIKDIVISKYTAYRGLMFSSCFFIEGELPKIIVIDDFTRIIKNQNIMYVDEEQNTFIDKETRVQKTYNNKIIKNGIRDIKITPADGSGLHIPQISKKWANIIGIEGKPPTTYMIRMPYFKGLSIEVDFRKFYKDKGINTITDIWGVKHSIDDIECIWTKSMYKGYSYFKETNTYNDFQKYLYNFKKYNHCLGITKWNFRTEEEPVYTRVNYQYLQTLKLDKDEFISLANYSKSWVEKILGGDKLYSYKFLGMHKKMDDYDYIDEYLKEKDSSDDKEFIDSNKNIIDDITAFDMKNRYMEALYLNSDMVYDIKVREYLINLLKKYISDFKMGKLWIKGCFKIVIPDIIMLMEYAGGMELKGCLKEGEFYSYGLNRNEYLIDRNPHICPSEHVILKKTNNKDIIKYLGHLENVCMLNGYDITMNRLNGCDTDGDLVFVTDNEIMKKGVQRDLPIVIDVDDKITALQELYNKDSVIGYILRSLDNRIGEISNVATCYLNKQTKNDEMRKKYIGYVNLLSVINGKEIDSAKTGVRWNIPYHIAKYARPLPYFMKYAGEYYSKLSILSKARSNLNYLCWDIEKWEKIIKYKKVFFDTSKILMNKDIEIKEDILEKIENIFLRFDRELTDLNKQNYCAKRFDLNKEFFEGYTKKEVENTNIDWDDLYNKYIIEVSALKLSDEEVATYAVYLNYVKYKNKKKNFCWSITGVGIIKNMISNQEEKTKLPIETCDIRDTEYLGRYYKLE
jgi:hypothetical protein